MRDKLLLAHPGRKDPFSNFSVALLVPIAALVSRILYWPTLLRPLWSIDIPIVILTTLYLVVLKPLIYLGIIKAYYPFEYDMKRDKKVGWYRVVIASAYGRFLAFGPTSYSKIGKELNVPLFIMSTVFLICFFISIYYKDRFVSIKRYTEGTRLIMLSESEKYSHCNMNRFSAGQMFMREYAGYKKNKSLEKQREKMMKNNKYNDPVLNELYKPEIERINQSNSNETETEDELNPVLRRQSRVKKEYEDN